MNSTASKPKHLLHFHADEVHFALTAAQFIQQATQANDQVQYRLPNSLKNYLLHKIREWGMNLPDGQLLEMENYQPDPDLIRSHTLATLDKALRDGYEHLYLLLWVPEVFPDYTLWMQAEAIWTELCDRHPLTVLCSFDMNDSEAISRVQEAFEHHSAYYSAGSPRTLAEMGLKSDSGTGVL